MVKKEYEKEVESITSKEKTNSFSGNTAKKDWVLSQNEYKFEIKKGQELPEGIPEHLMKALKTEGVI